MTLPGPPRAPVWVAVAAVAFVTLLLLWGLLT